MTKQSRTLGWITNSLRSGYLALAAQSLIVVAGCVESPTAVEQTPDDGEDDADDGKSAPDDGDDLPDVGEDETEITKPSDVPPPMGKLPPEQPRTTDGSKADGGALHSGSKNDGGTSSAKPADGGTSPGAGLGEKPQTGDSACLDTITDFDKNGPFKVEQKTSGTTKMWVPVVPAGCKVPVVHIANGTGGTCGSYAAIHTRMASQGFLSVCFENTNTGAGTGGLMAIETARSMHPDLVSNKIGSNGHSQGGQAAFIVLALAESKFGPDFTFAGLAMEPASGFGTQPSGGSWQSWYAKIKSPMLAFSGTADTLVAQSWVQQGYDALNEAVEAYHWSAIGATHVPIPTAHTQEIAVRWFRWKLLGDKKACEAMLALKTGSRWKELKSQNAKMCD